MQRYYPVKYIQANLQNSESPVRDRPLSNQKNQAWYSSNNCYPSSFSAAGSDQNNVDENNKNWSKSMKNDRNWLTSSNTKLIGSFNVWFFRNCN